ncbi:uncharacterized protein LOC121399720 [Xenopus laevis]|uniref:Uncharacterized protein LOC121399720 n=1 Tax=Xenopus laevis TaxID=8355 RepID=A0A8J1M837_XENLA|nr:uncharacterized protein LOC121399720 [Xenopus laevis]
MAMLYDDPDRASSADSAIRKLRQGKRVIEEYCTEFHRWSVETGWNDTALRSQFRVGLSSPVKNSLVNFPPSSTLDDLMRLAIQIDRRQRERRAEEDIVFPTTCIDESPTPSFPNPQGEPMQLGATRLSSEERARRRSLGLCMYCGDKGHFLKNCPKRPGNSQNLCGEGKLHLGREISSSQFASKNLVPVVLSWPGGSVTVSALVDSGAGGNFLDAAFAERYNIPLNPLTPPMRISAIDKSPLGSGLVTQKSKALSMCVNNMHYEKLAFHILDGSSSPLILGLPWLQVHNPHIDWVTGEVIQWGSKCQDSCLASTLMVAGTSLEKLPSVEHSSKSCSGVRSSLSAVPSAQKRAVVKSHREVPKFQVGDLVWLSTGNIKLKIPALKQGPKVIGPYPIVEIVNPTSVRLELPEIFLLSNLFHVSVLKPAIQVHQQSCPTSVLVKSLVKSDARVDHLRRQSYSRSPETGCTVNWSESEEPAEQVVLQSQPSKLHSRDVSLMEQFKIMLRTELDITTKRITTSLSKEIKEISKRTDTLEHRLDDATTVLEGHETEIDSLCYQLQELQDKMEDMENRSHRGNIRIRGFSESYKNLESDITEFFSILVPHLPSSRMEIDRIHRALGRPPQEGNPRDVILKLHYYTTKETIMQAA